MRSSDTARYKDHLDRTPPPPRPPARFQGLRSHTIVIKNYPSEYLSDRNLWNDFRHAGFIRDVEARPPLGYIRFDTQDDAIFAVEDMDGRALNRSKIVVETVEDREVGLPAFTVKLLPEAEDIDIIE